MAARVMMLKDLHSTLFGGVDCDLQSLGTVAHSVE